MHIIPRAIADLHPHPENARQHPPEQLDALWRIYQAHGQVTPVIIWPGGPDERGTDLPPGTILKGHGWVQMLQAHGKTEVDRSGTYDGNQPTAYMLADNHSGDQSFDDKTMLADLLHSLEAGGIDVGAAGYRDDEITALMQGMDAARDTEAATSAARRIASEEEIQIAHRTAEDFSARIVKRVQELAEKNPQLLNSAIAIAVPTDRGHECLIFTDRCTPDILAELRRLIAEDAASPLAELFAAINPL